MKKPKNVERLERIQKESNRLLSLVENAESSDIVDQIRKLTTLVSQLVSESQKELAFNVKAESEDLGKWNIANVVNGVCVGFYSIKDGKNTIVKDLIHATEFIYKKDAQDAADKLGESYLVIGYPHKA